MEAVGDNLTHLDLSGSVGLTDGLLFHGLQPFATRLTSLILSGLVELSDSAVAEFFSTWHADAELPKVSLVRIDLSRDHQLSGKALNALLDHSGKTLEHLNINGWKETPLEDLMRIGKSTPALKKLDIGWCREVDDWVVKEVINTCEHIEEIKVFGCQRLTERCPRKVRKCCQCLHTKLICLHQRNVDVIGVETHMIR